MRRTVSNGSSVEGDARDVGGADVGRESAIEKKRARMRVLVIVSGAHASLRRGGLVAEGGLGKK